MYFEVGSVKIISLNYRYSCKASYIFSSADELQKWSHLKRLRISKVLGSAAERKAALTEQAEIYITNRENVDWLVSNHSFDFDMIVIDELSSFKSYQSKRFRALRKVRPLAKRVVGLTGTPTPNGLMDLWAEINILDMGERLGRFISRYREAYFKPDKRNGLVIFSYKPLPEAEKLIYEKISDICISMKAADFLKLPERIDNVVSVEMNKAERKLYDKLSDEMLLPFADGDIDAVNAAALSNKLLQIANGAVYDENGKVRWIHDRKLDALEDLVEASVGKPLLVFYNFKHDKDRIAERFTVRDIQTEQDIRDWNSGKIPIAVAHPASCSHGLNLQSGGSTVIWFGLNWSLELYQQANARLYRQGQKNTVVIHHIITKDTIDESVIGALERKDIG